MATVLKVETTLQPEEVREYINSVLQSTARSWKVNLRTLSEETRVKVLPVVVSHVKRKLKSDFGILWSVDTSSVGISIQSPETIEEIEDALNTPFPHIALTPDGAFVTEDADGNGILLDDLGAWLENTIREYIKTAIFLTIGAVKNNENR